MRRGYWKCPEGTYFELQNPVNYFQKAMPFFSVITSTAHTFSAAIWRMTIGATSGLRIFILPMVYVRYFNTRFDKTLICTATIIESLGIMGLTYCLTMAPNQLYEAVSRMQNLMLGGFIQQLKNENATICSLQKRATKFSSKL